MFPNCDAGNGIQSSRRFVEKEDFRMMHQSASNFEPPSHAARERFGGRIAPLCQVHQLQQFGDRFLALFRRNVVELGVNIHVLFDRQVEIAGQRLRNHANHSSRCVRFFGDIVTTDERLARSDRDERSHHANQRRLPCSVGAQQSEDFAFLHAEGNGVDRGENSVFLDDMLDLDGRRSSGIVNRLLQP